MLENGICEVECLSAECLYDSGDCELCVPGCYLAMLGNSVCDDACNVAECSRDGGDCDCAPGCGFSLLHNEECDEVCALSSCEYDSHLCVINTQGDCSVGCFDWMIDDGHCDTACNSDACGWDGLDCGCAPGCNFDDQLKCKEDCNLPQCNYGLETDQLMALTCENVNPNMTSGYYVTTSCFDFFLIVPMNCCEDCCDWLRPSELNPEVCVLDPDTSSASSPQVFYVSANANAEADGSEARPYSLHSAFKRLYQAYTTFLLFPGEHDIEATHFFVKTYYDGVGFQPPVPIQKVIIIPRDCIKAAAGCVRVTLKYVQYHTYFDMSNIFSMEFSYVDFYSPLEPSDCYVCVLNLNFFFLSANRELILAHVAFRHFRGLLASVVDARGGVAVLTDVDFEDISPFSKMNIPTEVISALSGAKIEYSGGSVTLLNNGLSYSRIWQIMSFLSCEYSTVNVSNVTFSHNFAETSSSDEVNLIKLRVCKQCFFHHCVFRNNIANSVIHYQRDLQITYNVEDLQVLVLESIEFLDCEFVNNTAASGTFTLDSMSHLPDLTIRNCTFTNELSASYGLISIQTSKKAFRSTDTWKYTAVGSRQVRTNIPAASAVLSNLHFSNCTVTQYGLIAISNYPKVMISDVEIDSSGAFQGANRFSNTIQDFEIFGGSIPANIPLVSAANCSSLLNFTSVRDLTITAFRSNAAKCRIGLQASGDSVAISYSTFTSGSPSALLLLQTSLSVSISFTVFDRIWSADSSVVVATGSVHIDTCSFQSNKRAMVVQSAGTVVVEHSQFAEGQGNAMTLYINTDSIHLRVCNCTFVRNVNAGDSGTLAVLANRENVQVALLITESRFLNNQVAEGAALLLLQKLTFTDDSGISSCEFSDNAVGTLFVTSSVGKLRLADSVFTNNTGGTVFFECEQPCLIHLANLTFVSNADPSVTLRSSTAIGIDLHFSKNRGTCFDLTSSKLSANTLSFSNNSADSGTALTLHASRAELMNATFRDSSARNTGGAVLAEKGSEFLCDFCSFGGLSAALGGAIFAKHESVVSISHSHFFGNSARDGFAILVASSSLASSIQHSEIEGNFGEGFGVISLTNAALMLTSTAIHNNTSTAYTSGIVAQVSSVSISHCELFSQSCVSGCFLYAFHSEVAIASSSFSAGAAEDSGGAVLALESTLSAQNCTFRNLSALAGAAFMLQSTSSIALESCQFLEIMTQSSGRGVIDVSDSSLRLLDVHFQFFHKSAVAGVASTLEVAYSEFADNDMASSGGGIACEACSLVSLSNSLFTRLRAGVGSAVYLNYEMPASSSNWEITGCQFSGNAAHSAGTVWLKGRQATIDNNRFNENSAEDFGGALALLGLSSTLHNNVFINNRARQGAGVYWREIQPIIINSLCEGNEAVYGDCVGSFAVAMRLEDNSTVSGLPSGQISPGGISLLLLDHYGEVVKSDSSSDGWLATEGSEGNLTGITHTFADKGRFIFSGFAVIAQPKTNVSLFVHTSAFINSYRIEVGLRNCVQGEMLSGLQCVVCEAGTYSLDPAQPCKKCPSEAICLGNFTLTPRPGYWRQSNSTDHFYKCPNQDACLGSTGLIASLTGECEEGYEGNMCQSCSIGYYRWGKVSCSKCPSPGVQVAVRLSIVAFVSALAVLIIRSVLQERGIHSTYAKVYMNYLQLVMLLGSFHLQWPYIMLRLFNAQESIGAFLEIAFSLRCLRMDEAESETYFHELILFSLFPLFLVGLFCGVWVLISLCKRSIPDFRLKLLGSATAVYFLAYPSVIRVMASAWTLEEVGAGELWLSGQQQRAFTGSHSKYALGLALPCGLLYGVFIPLALAAAMRVNNKVNALNFGFLTQGYRSEMYYWEIVSILRVTLVVLCIPLLSRVSPAFQVLSALAVLFGSLLLHRSCHPFADNAFNALEHHALVIVIVTLYAGLFYYAAQLTPNTEVALSAVIIATNVHFTVRCWRKSALVLLSAAINNISKRLKMRRRQ